MEEKQPKKGANSWSDRPLLSSSKTPAFGNDTDISFVVRLEGGKVYLYAVIDTYSSLALGFLYVSKQSKVA